MFIREQMENLHKLEMAMSSYKSLLEKRTSLAKGSINTQKEINERKEKLRKTYSIGL